jgi:hypothetical protein
MANKHERVKPGYEGRRAYYEGKRRGLGGSDDTIATEPEPAFVDYRYTPPWFRCLEKLGRSAVEFHVHLYQGYGTATVTSAPGPWDERVIPLVHEVELICKGGHWVARNNEDARYPYLDAMIAKMERDRQSAAARST